MHRRALAPSAVAVALTALATFAPAAAQAQAQPVTSAQPAAPPADSAQGSVAAGVARREAGDHTAALKFFQAAYAADSAPTTGMEVAREQVALGQLIEARETAQKVGGSTQAGAENDKAKAEAAALIEKLNPRIPSIQLAVKGAATGVLLKVQLDGNRIPPANLATPRSLNPGEHTISVQADGYAGVNQSVTLPEAVITKVEVILTPAANAQAAKAPVPAAARAMTGKSVVLKLKGGDNISGKLLGVDENGLAVETGEHTLVLLARSSAQSMKLAEGESMPEIALPAPSASAPAGATSEAPQSIVTIDTNNPDVGLYRKGGQTLGSQLVCSAPCGVPVDRAAGDEFYFAIKKNVLGDTFNLPTSSSGLTFKIHVDSPPNRARKIAGAVLLPVGLVDALVGAVYMAVDWNRLTQQNVNDLYHTIGVGVAIVGGAMSLTGLVLLISSRGSYEITEPPGVQKVASPAKVEWRGLAFAPPLPTPSGLSPVTAMATWAF